MALTRQQKIARKAVRTTQARRAFRERYGQTVYEVVFAVRLGVDSQTIRDNTGVSAGQLAAIRANLTRGTYDAWLKGCNF